MDPNRKSIPNSRCEFLVVKSLEWVDKSLARNLFSDAWKKLNEAEQNGATVQEISEYKEKIVTAEKLFEVKKTAFINLAKEKIAVRDVDEAKKILDILHQLGIIKEVREISTEIISIEILQKVQRNLEFMYSLLGEESPKLSKIGSLISEARCDLAIAKAYKPPPEQVEEYANRIKAVEILSDVERKIGCAQQYQSSYKCHLDDAMKCLSTVEPYIIPREYISALHSKIKAVELQLQKKPDEVGVEATKHLEKLEKHLTEAQRLMAQNDLDDTGIHIKKARGCLYVAKTFDIPTEHLAMCQHKIDAVETMVLIEQTIVLANRYNSEHYLKEAKEKFSSLLLLQKQYHISNENINDLQHKIDAVSLPFLNESDTTVEENIGKSGRADMSVQASNHNTEKLFSDFAETMKKIPVVHNAGAHKRHDKQIPEKAEQSNDKEKQESIHSDSRDCQTASNSATAKSCHVYKTTEYKQNDTSYKNDSEFDTMFNQHGNNQRYVTAVHSENDANNELKLGWIDNTGHKEHYSSVVRRNSEHTNFGSENKASFNKQADPVSVYGSTVNKESTKVNASNNEQNNEKFQALMNELSIGKCDNDNYQEERDTTVIDIPGTPPPHANLDNAFCEEKQISFADKCILLANKALVDGNIEIAQKIVCIGEKLYPEADFSFTWEAIFAASSQDSQENSARDNLATRIENLHIHDSVKTEPMNTGNNNISHKVSNTGYAIKTKEKSYIKHIDDTDKTEEINTGNNNIMQKKSNTVYALKTKEKNCINPIDDEAVNGVSEENLNGNKEEAKVCLDKAREALDSEDFEKAQRLVTKSDRMCASEEAKTLLAKIIEVKNSKRHVNPSGTKTEGNNCSVTSDEDFDQSRKCLEIACTAFAKDEIVKCRRFLTKAKNFDKSLNIECYLARLNEKKVAAEIEKELKKKQEAEKQEKVRMAKQREAQSWDFVGKARNFLGIGTDSKQGSNKETKKLHQDNKSNKETHKNINCLKHNKNEDKFNAAKTETVNQTNNNREEVSDNEDMLKNNASGGNTGKNNDSLNVSVTSSEEEANKTKSEELFVEAMKCFEDQDFERAEALLTTAYGLYPAEHIQLALEEAKNMKINQKEETEIANNNEEIPKNIKENPKSSNEKDGTNTYKENKQHYNDKLRYRTYYNSNQKPYEPRARPNRSNSRGAPYGNGNARPNRSKSRGESYENDRARPESRGESYKNDNARPNRSKSRGESHNNDNARPSRTKSPGESDANNHARPNRSQSRGENYEYDHARPNRSKSRGDGEFYGKDQARPSGSKSPGESFGNDNARPTRSLSHGELAPPNYEHFQMQNFEVMPTANFLKSMAIKALQENNYDLAETYLVRSEQQEPNRHTMSMLRKVRSAKNKQSNIF